jgi:hypothetical protein
MPGSLQPQPQHHHTSLIEQSLQFLVANSHATNAKLDEALAELKDMKARVVQNENDIKHAFSEIFDLKEKLNSFEQRDCATAVRIFGLPLSNEEKEGIDPQKAAAKVAYERLLRPILSSAKDKGFISTLPHLSNVIQEAFRLSPKNNSSSASSHRPVLPPSSSNLPPLLSRRPFSKPKVPPFLSLLKPRGLPASNVSTSRRI